MVYEYTPRGEKSILVDFFPITPSSAASATLFPADSLLGKHGGRVGRLDNQPLVGEIIGRIEFLVVHVGLLHR